MANTTRATNGNGATSRRERKPQDAELAAMASILRTLSGLDAPTRERVMAYVNKRIDADRAIDLAASGGAEG